MKSFAELLKLYDQSKPKKSGISKLASIAKSSTLGKDLYIGEFTVVHENVQNRRRGSAISRRYISVIM